MARARRLDPGVAEAVVRGVAEGCRIAGCALVGGETAELPGMYAPGEYDLDCHGTAHLGRRRERTCVGIAPVDGWWH